MVQADVNRLSGVVSRSFLSADDVIFKVGVVGEIVVVLVGTVVIGVVEIFLF